MCAYKQYDVNRFSVIHSSLHTCINTHSSFEFMDVCVNVVFSLGQSCLNCSTAQ